MALATHRTSRLLEAAATDSITSRRGRLPSDSVGWDSDNNGSTETVAREAGSDSVDSDAASMRSRLSLRQSIASEDDSSTETLAAEAGPDSITVEPSAPIAADSGTDNDDTINSSGSDVSDTGGSDETDQNTEITMMKKLSDNFSDEMVKLSIRKPKIALLAKKWCQGDPRWQWICENREFMWSPGVADWLYDNEEGFLKNKYCRKWMANNQLLITKILKWISRPWTMNMMSLCEEENRRWLASNKDFIIANLEWVMENENWIYKYRYCASVSDNELEFRSKPFGMYSEDWEWRRNTSEPWKRVTKYFRPPDDNKGNT